MTAGAEGEWSKNTRKTPCERKAGMQANPMGDTLPRIGKLDLDNHLQWSFEVESILLARAL